MVEGIQVRKGIKTEDSEADSDIIEHFVREPFSPSIIELKEFLDDVAITAW
jgi:hypothetical protein